MTVTVMNSQKRRYDIAGEKVYHSYHTYQRNGHGIYIKLPHEGESGYGDIIQEFESYKKISPYLRMPNVRLLKDEKGEDVLAIQKILGESMGDLFLKDPGRAYESLMKYVDDLNMMWKDSVRKMDVSLLSINKQARLAQRVESFFHFEDTKGFLTTDSINVNGVAYTDLVAKLNQILSSLKTKSDYVMTLGHGDDHLGNILNDNTAKDNVYYIIDPLLSGYYSPATSYLNAAMYLLLYKYTFTVEQKTKLGGVVINYKLNNSCKRSLDSIIKVLKTIEGNLSALSNKPFLIKEYAVSNLLRFVQRMNDSKNFAHTSQNTLVYLGIAIELSNGKYNQISEIYENLR